MQSKRHSLVESITNVIIGYGVAVLSQIAIFPMFAIHISITDNLAIGAWFTAISIARSYFVRRFFAFRTDNSELIESRARGNQKLFAVRNQPEK